MELSPRKRFRRPSSKSLMVSRSKKNRPRVSRSGSTPQTLNCLEFMGDPNDDFLGKAILSDYFLLMTIFPEFPQSMLQALLVREEGNAAVVFTDLVDRGWSPKRKELITKLSNMTNQLFSLEYYWGELTEENVSKLRQSAVGTFCSGMKDQKYFLCYVNESNSVIEEPVSSPIIFESQRENYSLSCSMKRPGNETLSPRQFVRFMSPRKLSPMAP